MIVRCVYCGRVLVEVGEPGPNMNTETRADPTTGKRVRCAWVPPFDKDPAQPGVISTSCCHDPVCLAEFRRGTLGSITADVAPDNAEDETPYEQAIRLAREEEEGNDT